MFELPQTVFTLKEISVYFPSVSYNNLKRRMSFVVKRGYLRKLRRGIFAKENYKDWELANRIYVPSYISLETVTQKEGITFQYYERIFSVGFISKTVEVDRKTFEYKRMKKEILSNRAGIKEEEGVFVASPERAFLDMLYFYKNYYFDNPGRLDFGKVRELAVIYGSKKLLKRIEEYVDTE